jgi:radical SAM superfamily enzyme YgiQ (UPF0313 family)
MIKQQFRTKKTLLLTPPGDSPCDCPWMGNPALIGHLRQAGFPQSYQRDLDLELYYYSQKPESHRSILELYKRELAGMTSSGKLWKRLFTRFFGRIMLTLLRTWELRDLKFFTQFRDATPVYEQFPEDGVIRYRKTLNRILKLMGVYYYPFLAYPKFFSTRDRKTFYRIHLWLGCLLHDHMVLGRKALVAFFESELIPQLRKENYDMIGISVSVQRQYDSAVVLAETIRKAGIKAKLVLGGSYISEVYDSEWLEDSVINSVDWVVRYEGEDAVHKLLLHLDGEWAIDDVPNLIYMKEGKRVETPRDRIRDIDTLATPNYDDLPLDLYLDRPVRLPVMGNRGCYWAKCTFCAHFWSLGVGQMRDRSAVKLVADMHELQERHGVRSFFFCDESMYPPTLDGLNKLIPESGMDVKWAGMIRFEESLDKKFLKSMYDAGCYALFFGLESMSQAMQDVIKKGTKVEVVWRILRDCKEIGIKVHLFFIMGIPGETEADMMESLNFMRNHPDLYETLQIAQFELLVGSPIYLKPERYGVENLEIVSDHSRLAYSEVAYDRVKGLSQEQIAAYVEEADNDEMIYRKNIWSGYGYTIYQPDPPVKTRPTNSQPPRPPHRDLLPRQTTPAETKQSELAS